MPVNKTRSCRKAGQHHRADNRVYRNGLSNMSRPGRRHRRNCIHKRPSDFCLIGSRGDGVRAHHADFGGGYSRNARRNDAAHNLRHIPKRFSRQHFLHHNTIPTVKLTTSTPVPRLYPQLLLSSKTNRSPNENATIPPKVRTSEPDGRHKHCQISNTGHRVVNESDAGSTIELCQTRAAHFHAAAGAEILFRVSAMSASFKTYVAEIMDNARWAIAMLCCFGNFLPPNHIGISRGRGLKIPWLHLLRSHSGLS
jgi:hypothetical protein